MTIRILSILSVLTTGVVVAVQPAAAADPFYQDKTITMLVGYDSGQTDLTARVFATFLEKTVPGNPTVIVKNMPGAAP